MPCLGSGWQSGASLVSGDNGLGTMLPRQTVSDGASFSRVLRSFQPQKEKPRREGGARQCSRGPHVQPGIAGLNRCWGKWVNRPCEEKPGRSRAELFEGYAGAELLRIGDTGQPFGSSPPAIGSRSAMSPFNVSRVPCPTFGIVRHRSGVSAATSSSVRRPPASSACTWLEVRRPSSTRSRRAVVMTQLVP
jgi:hypothetical protein